MNNIYKWCIDNNIKINKIINKGNYYIIYNDFNKYLLKKKNNLKLVKYNLPLIKSSNEYEIYKYYDDIYNKKDKLNKIILLLNSIQLESIIDKNIDYEKIYNDLNNNINSLMNYYLKLQDELECILYPRFDYLLLIENISMFYKILSKAKEINEYWYSINDNIRSSLCLNNISMNNFIVNDQTYIIDSSSITEDLIINDYIKIYRDNYDIFDLFNDNFKLNEKELFLFLTYISIPNKIVLFDNVCDNVKIIKEELNYVRKTLNLVLEKYKENEKADKNKFNE